MSKLKISHRGKWHDRTRYEQNQLEKALAEAWEKENQPRGYDGVSTILMCMEPNSASAGGFAQATAMATAIQWLGSNVGFCFLTGVLERNGYEVRRKR